MKITQKNIYLIVSISLFICLIVIWKNGSLNDYLPFFMTTDGWNKYEREMNTQVPDGTSKVSVTYTSEKSSLSVSFDNANNTVTLSYPEIGTVTLLQAVSASGARYINTEESIVFWEHQGEGLLEVRGVELFRGIHVEIECEKEYSLGKPCIGG